MCITYYGIIYRELIFGVESSLYRMETMLINDLERTLIDLGTRDVEMRYDDISHVVVDRMAEDLSEPIGASNSNSLFHSSVNQMTQEKVSLNRKVAYFNNKSPAGQGEVMNVSRSLRFKSEFHITNCKPIH